MCTYYNKRNYNVKESPEQNLIEMSISETNKRFFVPVSKALIKHSQNYSQKSKKGNLRETNGKIQGQKLFLAVLDCRRNFHLRL